jgi:hypothetical protein
MDVGGDVGAFVGGDVDGFAVGLVEPAQPDITNPPAIVAATNALRFSWTRSIGDPVIDVVLRMAIAPSPSSGFESSPRAGQPTHLRCADR